MDKGPAPYSISSLKKREEKTTVTKFYNRAHLSVRDAWVPSGGVIRKTTYTLGFGFGEQGCQARHRRGILLGHVARMTGVFLRFVGHY